MLGERFVARLMLCVVEICLDYVDFKQLRFQGPNQILEQIGRTIVNNQSKVGWRVLGSEGDHINLTTHVAS